MTKQTQTYNTKSNTSTKTIAITKPKTRQHMSNATHKREKTKNKHNNTKNKKNKNNYTKQRQNTTQAITSSRLKTIQQMSNTKQHQQHK